MNTLQHLGFPAGKKLLIIHADDAGLSHSQNRAIIDTIKNGAVNSYSIMVPCPWFYEIALFAQNNPKYDYGIHLTLTNEWENYKFGPVLPVSEVPSLVDENGYFYKSRKLVDKHANVDEVKKELEAQINRALQFGLQPSHIDSHMYSVGSNPELFKVYKALQQQYGLPAFMERELLNMFNMPADQMLDDNDFLIDEAFIGEYHHFEEGGLKDLYFNTLNKLSPGLNLLLVHPAFDDNEMKGITYNHPNFGSEWRQIDYDVLMSKDFKACLEKNNIELITWKAVKERMQR